jgi:hypothetical protein
MCPVQNLTDKNLVYGRKLSVRDGAELIREHDRAAMPRSSLLEMREQVGKEPVRGIFETIPGKLSKKHKVIEAMRVESA